VNRNYSIFRIKTPSEGAVKFCEVFWKFLLEVLLRVFQLVTVLKNLTTRGDLYGQEEGQAPLT